MGGSYDNEGAWSPLALALWAAWLLAFGLLEYRGLLRSGDDWPPLTYVFKRYVPEIIAVGGCAWLLHHAIETYRG